MGDYLGMKTTGEEDALASSAMDRDELIKSMLQPFHQGLIVSLISSSVVIFTFAMKRERRRHPASLIVLRSVADFLLCLLWLVTSLDWTSLKGECDDSTKSYFTAVATEFLVITSETLIACVSFDLLIHAGDPFADYVANVFTYIVLVLAVSASFAFGLFATGEEHIGASFLPVCWVKYHGGKVFSNANVSMSIFFYAPWTLFFLLSVAALSRACVFLSLGENESGKPSARLAALKDARRVILAHASYYGLLLVFYAPLVNSMKADDDAETLTRRQDALMVVVRFLSGARAIENLFVWFPKMTAKNDGNATVGGNADLSPLLNVEMQRDVLLSSVTGMCLTLKARRVHANGDDDLTMTFNLGGLSGANALKMIRGGSRSDDVDLERQDQVSNLDTPLLWSNGQSPQSPTTTCNSCRLRNMEQVMLFVSIAPIQFACISAGLFAVWDEKQPSYVSILFLTGFLFVAVVSFGSYLIASIQLGGRSRAIVSELKGKDFAALRAVWKISESSLVQSLSECISEGDARFTLSSGRSGAFMFFSPDGRYVVKTIPPKEQRVLLEKILPALSQHARLACPEFTSLARVLGVFSLKVFGRDLVMVVSENVLLGSSDATKYDLKGSWVNRSSSVPQNGKVYVCEACGKPFVVGSEEGSKCALSRQGHVPRRLLKDNEFRERILGETELLLKIRAQIERDVNFLASLGIMDYSLLLCVRHRVIHLNAQGGQAQYWEPGSRLLLSSVMEGANVFQFGIIDWFTEFDRSKRLERCTKTRLLCKQEYDERDFPGLSTTEPDIYKERFLARVVDVVFPLLTNLVQLVDQRRNDRLLYNSITLDVSDVVNFADLCSAAGAASGFKVDPNKDEFVCATGDASTEPFVVVEDTMRRFKAFAYQARMCTLTLKRKAANTSSDTVLIA